MWEAETQKAGEEGTDGRVEVGAKWLDFRFPISVTRAHSPLWSSRAPCRQEDLGQGGSQPLPSASARWGVVPVNGTALGQWRARGWEAGFARCWDLDMKWLPKAYE